ncbi:SpvB/TcaC N-terminal domain-containing protein [Streptomyces sp. NPDC056491]|uniref:SpvB/TcaC N-terminal domain-containing protein n=1 Tax=Streptomyces sp. NPDC056491 TaxID=3345837 RepID=UPI00368928AE
MGEKFSALPLTGTASLSVPVSMTQARGGAEPKPTLIYDSGAGNGPFGLGWAMELPSISRSTDKGLPRYLDDADTFQLSGAEDLVPALFPAPQSDGPYEVTTYRPRTEGVFSRIERRRERNTGDTHWRVTSPDNVTSVFGRDPAARISDPDQPGNVFRWLLEESSDDRGNIVRYSYKKEDGGPQRYPKRIRYGNKNPGRADDFCLELVLDYGEHAQEAPTPDEEQEWTDRADPFSNRRSGFEVRTRRLCRRILMFHRIPGLGPDPVLVNSTRLEYLPDPASTKLVSITHQGHVLTGSGYATSTLPTLRCRYTPRTVSAETHALVAPPGEPPPRLDGPHRWADLDGNGIAGVLTELAGAWYYWPNCGNGLLGGPRPVDPLPAGGFSHGRRQLLDLTGRGRPALADLSGPVPGYHGRAEDGGWEPLTAFRSLPSLPWSDRNLRFVDLTGDGLADVLTSGDDGFTWYPSLGPDGFGDSTFVPAQRTVERGPRLMLSDPEQSVYLADMTGDGLTDLVRIGNGETVYWPSLGHGRFGPKVTMTGAPVFDRPDLFDPRRIHLADVDGSAPADLVYAGRDGVRVWFNQAGNGWSDPQSVQVSVPTAAAVSVTDVLGHGTACLVLAESRPDGESEVRYVDLMAAGKPHLLYETDNGVGLTTTTRYASSVEFALADAAAGRPWATSLPFPVQVVAEATVRDSVADTTLVTSYRYRHGHYDGVEREFRGFGFVERREGRSYAGPGSREYEPATVTRRWQHTGADGDRLSACYEDEYGPGDPSLRLPDTVVPPGLTTAERREAVRALRGRVLREEVYAEDEHGEPGAPYAVTESNYRIRVLQPLGSAAHCVVHARDGETLSVHSERAADDPRIGHQLTLDVDDWGNPVRVAHVAYPRRPSARTDTEQQRLWMTVAEQDFANEVGPTGSWRIGVPVEQREFEASGIRRAGELFTEEELRSGLSDARADELPYGSRLSDQIPQRRLLSRTRHTYTSDDLTAELPAGRTGIRALPWQSYQQVYAPGQPADLFGDRVSEGMLRDAGFLFEEGLWWLPSGRQVFDPDRFFLPVAHLDAFGARWDMGYDQYSLRMTEVRDPLRNLTRGKLNFRVLQPWLVTDPNGNRSGVRFDALGFVTATAVLGKFGAGEGDHLDLSTAEASPEDSPTTTLVYELGEVPVRFRARSREQHASDLPRTQEKWTYIDGSGRVALTKVQAEPVNGTPRWVGTGRVVYDDHGRPVRQYEPYFSAGPGYEAEEELSRSGVTPRLHYDPLHRLVRTEHPDGSESRVSFTAWEQRDWDGNDTVRTSRWYADRSELPASDPRRRAAELTLVHADTPRTTVYDALGRAHRTITDNGSGELLEGTVERDVQGNELAVIDPRGVRVLEKHYDMLGRPAYARSPDAGERWSLQDAGGLPVHAWQADGTASRLRHDALRRTTHAYAAEPGGVERLRSRTYFGEALPDGADRNLRGRACLVFDGAGLVRTTAVDFKGNTTATERCFTLDPRNEPDWSAAAGAEEDPGRAGEATAALLEEHVYRSHAAYDALNRPTLSAGPDGSLLRRRYDEAGLLEGVDLSTDDGVTWQPVVANADHNARGQRVLLELGDGAVRTACQYERDTFRLSTVDSRGSDGELLQALRYTYDPAGNVVATADLAQETRYFANAVVPAGREYAYDPAYRLTGATGREHIGQTAASQPGPRGTPMYELPHVNDAEAMRRYSEAYTYDAAGNLLRLVHAAGSGSWTRRHEVGAADNRLYGSSLPGDPDGVCSARYTYDASGNLLSMPHLPGLGWDVDNRLATVDLGGGGRAYYQYDAAGRRVRATVDRGGTVETRVYDGPWERYTKTVGEQVRLERDSLHVTDEGTRLALVERTGGRTLVRFQLGDLLDSAVVEVDGNGRLLSYEEYHPYGTTSFRSAAGAAQVSLKRYRFNGKEQDTETGFAYHGARYYAPWLARWTAPDPVQPSNSGNSYAYGADNPVRFTDPDGRNDRDAVGKVLDQARAGYEKFKNIKHQGEAGDVASWGKQLLSKWSTTARNWIGGGARLLEKEHPVPRALGAAAQQGYDEGKALTIQVERALARLKTVGDNRISRAFKAGQLTRAEAAELVKRNFLDAWAKANRTGATKLTRQQVVAAADTSIREVFPELGHVYKGVVNEADKVANVVKQGVTKAGPAAKSLGTQVKSFAAGAKGVGSASTSLVKNTTGAARLPGVVGGAVATVSMAVDLANKDYLHVPVSALKALPGTGLIITALDTIVDELVEQVGIPMLKESDAFSNHVIWVNKALHLQ